MNQTRDVITVALVVVAAGLACKGKGSGGGSGAGSAAPSAAACTPSTKEVKGSLHAEVAFETAMDPPRSKRKEAYQCNGRDAVAFLMEYATPAAAGNACNLVGPQLWGGGAPTLAHPEELLTKDSTLVIVSGKAIDDLSAKFAAEGYAKWRAGTASGGGGGRKSAVDDLKATVDCSAASTDALRAWCAVGAAPGSGFNLPAKPTTYVGITAAVKSGTAARSALLGDVTVSALSIGDGRIKVTSITPDNESEKKTLLKTAAKVSEVLKSGSTSDIAVGSALAGFLDGLKKDLSTKGYAVAPSSGKPAAYTGAIPAEVALVPGKVEAYVVIEHANDGTWLNVFPIRTYAP